MNYFSIDLMIFSKDNISCSTKYLLYQFKPNFTYSDSAIRWMVKMATTREKNLGVFL